MKHTDAEIEEAARRFETLADELDPERQAWKTSPTCAPSPRPPSAPGEMRRCSLSAWRWPGRMGGAGTG